MNAIYKRINTEKVIESLGILSCWYTKFFCNINDNDIIYCMIKIHWKNNNWLSQDLTEKGVKNEAAFKQWAMLLSFKKWFNEYDYIKIDLPFSGSAFFKDLAKVATAFNTKDISDILCLHKMTKIIIIKCNTNFNAKNKF